MVIVPAEVTTAPFVFAKVWFWDSIWILKSADTGVHCTAREGRGSTARKLGREGERLTNVGHLCPVFGGASTRFIGFQLVWAAKTILRRSRRKPVRQVGRQKGRGCLWGMEDSAHAASALHQLFAFTLWKAVPAEGEARLLPPVYA